MIPIPSRGNTWIDALTLIAAILPAVITWWTDRQLLDKADDPALPELLASRRRTNIRAMAIGFAIVVVWGGNDAAWGIPLLVTLLIAAAYPLRTRLLGETWGFGAYVWHGVLSLAGGFGFWIALAYAPAIVQRLFGVLGVERWPVVAVLAAVLAAALFALEAWFPRIWLWSHAAAPLVDPVLTPRFEEIVRRAGSVSPRVYRVGPKGSRFVNAVALPSATRPAVAMGNATLELLDPDEATAIFAHEIAHFDHLTPKRMARSQLINRLLIVVGVSFPFVTAFGAGPAMRWVAWVWPLAVLFALVRRAAKSQQHETESDLRAVALCGDPEALVRGLVKLHFHARIPRRYAVDVERAATHPSLVRRIQAIRGAGAAVEQLDAATVIRSTRAGSWVVFDAERAYWLDGVPEGVGGELAALREAASSYRAVNYADLVELRVAAAGDARTIAARVRGGDAWTVPISGADVARLQRTLDVVDLRLGKAGPAPSSAIPKVTALAALVATLVAGQVGIVLAPIVLALWKPTASAFAAIGAMSVVRVVLGAFETGGWLDASATQAAQAGFVALAVAGVAAFYSAFRLARADDGSRHARLTISVLGAVALLVALVLLMQMTKVPLAEWVGHPLVGTLGLAIVGLAAALFVAPMRWSRPAAFATLVAGAAAVMLGVDRQALALRGALAATTARATLVSEAELGGAAYGLRVSPDGSHFLAMRAPTGRRGTPRRTASLLLGRFGGSVRELTAVGGGFVDDRRVLVLDALERGLEVRLESVDSAAAPIWADTLTDADLFDARLLIDRDSSSWAVVGEDADDDRTAVFAGRIGQRGVMRRAALPDTLAMIGEPIVFGDGSTVVVPTFVNMLRVGVSAMWMMPMLGMDPMRSELWRARGDSLVRIASVRGVPECGEPLGGVAACTTQHVKATSLYTIDASGAVVEVARLEARDGGVMALGPGPRAASMKFDRSVRTFDLAARRLTTIRLPAGSDYASEVRTGDGYVVTLSYGENKRVKVSLYRIGR